MDAAVTIRGHGPHDGDIFDRIVRALHDKGYIVLEHVFDTVAVERLFTDIKRCDSRYFHTAGVGRAQDQIRNRFIRQDRICWLDPEHPPIGFYLEWMELLRECLNRELLLGLFDYECHYAHYPRGTFYKKHLDAFRGSMNRRLSTILYLNPVWQADDGGELVIYAVDNRTVLETVRPCLGTLVLFLSEEFPHEVLTARRSRYSLTGWFRVNNSNSQTLDPGR